MNRSKTTKAAFVFFLSTLINLNAFAQQLSYNQEVLDDALELEITVDPQQTLGAYILLKDQVDIRSLNQQFTTLRANKAQRARTLVTALKNKANQTQSRLLNELQQAPEVVPGSIRPLWITNMIMVEATGTYLAQLSKHPNVQRIEAALVDQIDSHSKTAFDAVVAPNGREPGLTAIQAHKMWELGYTGYGTKVMVIDNDIDFSHRALKTQFFYNNAPIEQAYTGEISGQICSSHGTNVVGLVVGIDRLFNDTLGVAFNAKYINGPSPFSDSEGNQCEFEGETLTPIENLQFALDPDGNPSTTDDIPDVINNSYGSSGFNSSRDCQNSAYENIIRALDAAGISVIFSAGNSGPEESSISFQASLSFDLYVPFVVGSVNNDNTVSDFSARGPSRCIDGPNIIKPEVVAPGNNIRTTRPSNGYDNVPGTSFSTPYVSGAFLLLKEAFPNLTGRQINEALLKSAKDLGPPGEDNAYGAGLIDVFAAYTWLIDQGNTPTPALRSNNDAILVDVETRNQDCDRMIQSFLTVANNGSEDITSLDVTYQRENDRSNLGTATWTGRIEPGTTKKIVIDPVNAFTGSYTVQVGIEKVNGRADLRSLDNFIKTEVNVVPDANNAQITITGQQICQGGQSMITATSDLPGVLRWYDAIVRGNLVAEGKTILLENVQSDTTLYASISTPGRVGMERADLGPNTFLSQSAGLVFDAESSFLLKSVKIFAESPGVRIIQLKRPDGELQQRVIPITSAGEQEMELNFEISPGEDLELLMSVGSGLAVTTNQTKFPYLIEDVVRINRSKGTVATFYAYFYDWDIEYENSCGRIVANIQVDNTGMAPDVAFMADNYVVDLDDQGGALVNFTSNSTDLVSYKWSFGDGFTSTQPNPSYNYTEPGIYNVTLFGTNASGCSNMAVQTVEVKPGVATSTQDQDLLSSQIDLFPNPAKDQVNLYLQFSQNKRVQYEIIDLLGKSYGRKNLGKISTLQKPVDISGLAAGTYILMLDVDGTRVGKRLVKTQ